jgi:hypothetical protein
MATSNKEKSMDYLMYQVLTGSYEDDGRGQSQRIETVVQRGCPATEALGNFLDKSDEDKRQWMRATAARFQLPSYENYAIYGVGYDLERALKQIMAASEECRHAALVEAGPGAVFKAAVTSSKDNNDADLILNAWKQNQNGINLSAVIDDSFYQHLTRPEAIPLLIAALKDAAVPKDLYTDSDSHSTLGQLPSHSRPALAANTLIMLTGHDIEYLQREWLPPQVSRNSWYFLKGDYCRDAFQRWSSWWEKAKGSIHWDSTASHPLDKAPDAYRHYKGKFVWEPASPIEASSAKKPSLLMWSLNPNLITLSAIPDPVDMTEIHLESIGIYADPALQLNEQKFKDLMRASRPVSASDPWLEEASFSPWDRGSFLARGVSYTFRLFVGGSGILQIPDGHFGYFRDVSAEDAPRPGKK